MILMEVLVVEKNFEWKLKLYIENVYFVEFVWIFYN